MPTPPRDAAATLDPAEVERFARMASDWWDPHGKFRPLHQLGPARLTFIRDRLCGHFGRSSREARPLAGLAILDVGCGGGLVTEPLARLSARVTGLDAAEENVRAAAAHAGSSGLDITYRTGRAEDLAAERAAYDAVLCLEVLEHVPDPAGLVRVLAALVRPGGMLILSTLNRTLKAYALAIVGAEYVLGWLPVGTHQWERFITPEELATYVQTAGLAGPVFEGLVYDPFAGSWSLSPDTSVNYMAAAAKSPGSA